ncbi:uncharacterized protein LOC111824919 [Myotis lucifugus]|uniref:uncharacterized protein LOC111824919 n=1 Tax=Myotis lucifugus TaxID=59463 RepID=UPI000CCC7BC6|nr:uncharacterized protein LOC111824919 [Myotis lucifugus]XP_023605380.1 uncharacterized protein LOC111824919 [Myotis lucifugus]XP_023605381.1 uncharacterized protein LOC111824919 [Myotis lucifugus]XP_023605382.1 uncharacterized protein LOC111824919 [Myotis lucifugus]
MYIWCLQILRSSRHCILRAARIEGEKVRTVPACSPCTCPFPRARPPLEGLDSRSLAFLCFQFGCCAGALVFPSERGVVKGAGSLLSAHSPQRSLQVVCGLGITLKSLHEKPLDLTHDRPARDRLSLALDLFEDLTTLSTQMPCCETWLGFVHGGRCLHAPVWRSRDWTRQPCVPGGIFGYETTHQLLHNQNPNHSESSPLFEMRHQTPRGSTHWTTVDACCPRHGRLGTLTVVTAEASSG